MSNMFQGQDRTSVVLGSAVTIGNTLVEVGADDNGFCDQVT